MSYEATDESRQRGSPINLYLFRYGPNLATDYYGYTDALVPHTFDPGSGSKTFTPIPIERDAVQAKSSLDRSSIDIRTPRTIDLAELFRVYPPMQVVTIVLYEGHVLEADGGIEFVAIWSGRILNCLREGSEAVFTCEPLATSMRRPGLRRHWQLGCPHALYGPDCAADQGAATVVATVSAVSGASVTLTAGWEGAFAPEKYVGGMLGWTNGGQAELRTILRVTGNVLSLSGIARGLAPAASVNVIRGCDHEMTGCTDHANIQNYGGQPWAPLANPFANVNNFG